MARVAALSDSPCARLNEMVVAGAPSWWLTEVGAEVWLNDATALSGTTPSFAALTATPLEAVRLGGATGPLSALTGAAPGAPAATTAARASANGLTAAAAAVVRPVLAAGAAAAGAGVWVET